MKANKAHRAILIDPAAQTVTEIEINSWKDIAPAMDCKLLTCPFEDENGETMYCDDEGLISGKELHFSFVRGISVTPVAGKVIILGTDQETGDSKDCTLTVEDVKNRTLFLPVDEVKMLASTGIFG